MNPLARARRILARPGAWIIEANGRPGCYQVRTGDSRRAPVLAEIDEAGFRALVDAPGLKTRPEGGWVAQRHTTLEIDPPQPGRPGLIEGDRTVMAADGAAVTRRANLAQTAVAWLARRRGPDGRPWLDAAQVAAAERLSLDAEAALSGPSLTMRWDALPRAGAGSSARVEPGDRQLAAGRRLEAALKACGPYRPMIEAVVIRASALQAAERDLGLNRRTGKLKLHRGLAALAVYYSRERGSGISGHDSGDVSRD